jgi:hypothetical protein
MTMRTIVKVQTCLYHNPKEEALASLNATGTVPTSITHLSPNNSTYFSNPSTDSDNKKDGNLYIPENPLLNVQCPLLRLPRNLDGRR